MYDDMTRDKKITSTISWQKLLIREQKKNVVESGEPVYFRS